jgi:hypothetical protein
LWTLRSLSLDEVEQWVDLVDLIQQVQLNEMADEVKWNFEKIRGVYDQVDVQIPSTQRSG